MYARFLLINLADNASLTATPDMSSGYPIRYLKLLSKKKSARTVDASDQIIRVDWLGEIFTINTVVLAGSNLTEEATIRLRAYSLGSESGDLVYDSGVIAISSNRSIGDAIGLYDSVFMFSDTDVGSLRFDVSDQYNPDGYLSFRRLMVGKSIIPEYNVEKSLSLTINDDSELKRTRAKSLSTHSKYTYRTISCVLSNIDNVDAVDWLTGFYQTGKDKEVYVSIFPDDSALYKRYSHGFIAKLQQDSDFSEDYFDHKSVSLTFVEA